MLLSCCTQNENINSWMGIANIKICSICGLAFQEPQPSDKELKEIYGQSYYDSWGATSGIDSYWKLKEELAKYILQKINILESNDRVLDIGCATGAFLSVIRKNGYIPYGIDVNSYSVQQARLHVPDAKVFQGSLDVLSNKKNFFHAIIFSDVLEHCKNPIHDLKIASELLTQGGKIVILTPDSKSFSAFIMRRKWIHLKREHLYYFSKFSLHKLLENNGFHMISIKSALKIVTLEYAINQSKSYWIPFMSPFLSLIERYFSQKLQRLLLKIPMGELLAIAIKK